MSTPRIGHPEHRILHAVGRYHFLTITQLMRLLGYSRGTKRTIEKRLATLVATGFLLPKRGYTNERGLPPSIYVLGREGRSYVASALPLPRRFRPGDQWKRDFYEHILGLNDVLIAAERLTLVSEETIWLAEMQHDHLLQERPFPVTTPRHDMLDTCLQSILAG